jgi:hypothetical protein
LFRFFFLAFRSDFQKMYGRMDRWMMDGWTDLWMDDDAGWTDEWMMDGRMDG